MSTRLDHDIATVDFENLVIGGAQVGTVKLQAAQGALKRGTVIDATGAVLTTGGTAKYILAEDVTVDDSEPTVAVVYITGKFVRNSLIVAPGYTFADADAENLRDVTIFVEDAMK